MDKRLEHELTKAIETYYALGNKDGAEKLKKMLNDSFEDDMIYGESILDLNKLECVRFGSKEYEKLYIAGYDPYDETDEPRKCAIFKDGKVVNYE